MKIGLQVQVGQQEISSLEPSACSDRAGGGHAPSPTSGTAPEGRRDRGGQRVHPHHGAAAL